MPNLELKIQKNEKDGPEIYCDICGFPPDDDYFLILKIFYPFAQDQVYCLECSKFMSEEFSLKLKEIEYIDIA